MFSFSLAADSVTSRHKQESNAAVNVTVGCSAPLIQISVLDPFMSTETCTYFQRALPQQFPNSIPPGHCSIRRYVN
jgi:hypothetical protein